MAWHASASSAQFDLFEMALTELLLVDALHGEAGLEKTLARACDALAAPVANWFARTASDEGLLEVAAEPWSWPGGAGVSPPRDLVRAFTLAHLQRQDEALRLLEEVISRWLGEDRHGSGLLRKALGKATHR